MKKFNQYGLAHDLNHLNEMRDLIAYLPIEEQAQYADQVCVETCDKIKLEQFDFGIESIFDEFNTTSVGNLAYVALNSPDEKVRERAVKILDLYRTYCESKNRLKASLIGIVVVSIVVSLLYFLLRS